MKRITSSIFLTTFILSSMGIFPIPPQAIAQTQENGDLFYLYKGQRILLNQRQDAIAVSFNPHSAPPSVTIGNFGFLNTFDDNFDTKSSKS
jgi:hypothetical protein